MSDYVDGMVGVFYRFGDTIVGNFPRHLFRKRSEHTVPDDEGHAHVAVEVGDIAGVVYPVMGRGYKEVFYPAGQFFYVLGMHQDAIYLRN